MVGEPLGDQLLHAPPRAEPLSWWEMFECSALSGADGRAGHGTPWVVQRDGGGRWGCVVWAGATQSCCMSRYRVCGTCRGRPRHSGRRRLGICCSQGFAFMLELHFWDSLVHSALDHRATIWSLPLWICEIISLLLLPCLLWTSVLPSCSACFFFPSVPRLSLLSSSSLSGTRCIAIYFLLALFLYCAFPVFKCTLL